MLFVEGPRREQASQYDLHCHAYSRLPRSTQCRAAGETEHNAVLIHAGFMARHGAPMPNKRHTRRRVQSPSMAGKGTSHNTVNGRCHQLRGKNFRFVFSLFADVKAPPSSIGRRQTRECSAVQITGDISGRVL